LVEQDDVVLERVRAEKVREPTTRTMRVTVDEVANRVEIMR